MSGADEKGQHPGGVAKPRRDPINDEIAAIRASIPKRLRALHDKTVTVTVSHVPDDTMEPGANGCDRHHFVWTWPIEGGNGSVGLCELCGAITTGERDSIMRSEALREAADHWTHGEWSNVMLPKPTPPALPVIAYSNRVGDWLRERATDLPTPSATPGGAS